jgi:hypothetical protein
MSVMAMLRQQSARMLPGYLPMGPKRRGIQLLGWLAILAGWAFLTRILIFARIANIWMLVGDALFAGLAAYLIFVGRRAVFAAKGQPIPKARFGWG